jgi:hypothetical protein
MRGGSKLGERRGVRQKGTKNKRTIEAERAQAEAAAKISAALGENAFPGDAHAFLVAVYKDKMQPMALRLDAAKAAIGYEEPRLSAIEGKMDGSITLADLVHASYLAAGFDSKSSETPASVSHTPAPERAQSSETPASISHTPAPERALAPEVREPVSVPQRREPRSVSFEAPQQPRVHALPYSRREHFRADSPAPHPYSAMNKPYDPFQSN